MAAPAASATDRYFRPGVSHVVLTPTVASATGAATRPEIDAGTDYSAEVQGVAGFTQQSATLEAPDWGSRVVQQVNGRITLAASSITFYADRLGDDVTADLELDDFVSVIFMDNGDVPTTGLMDVFKCQVGSIAKGRDGDNVPTVTVSFTLKGVFERKAIPA